MNHAQEYVHGQEQPILKMPASPLAPAGKLPAVLLFGMPGVGKGTQGSLLGTMSGMFHVSTGEIFRSLDMNTEDGRLVASLIDQGNLVPDEVTIRIWHRWMQTQIEEGAFNPLRDVLVLDGLPRRVAQCELLKEHIDVLSVVHLESPSDDPIIERLRGRALTEGRADDADESIIRRRFEIYRQKTQPVLSYYSSAIVHTVNPLGTQMEIKKRILESIIPAIRQYQQAG